MFLCEQQGEGKRMNKDTYTESSQKWVRNVFYHSLEINKNSGRLLQNRISRLYVPHNIPWESPEVLSPQLVFSFCIIHSNLMYNCTIFSALRLIRSSLNFARTTSTSNLNTYRTKLARITHGNILTVTNMLFLPKAYL